MSSLTFSEGLLVRYNELEGNIHFICEKYLTLRIKQSGHKRNDVCVLIYRSHWNEIRLPCEDDR